MGNEDHIDPVLADQSHQPGESNGCVTRCKYEPNATGKMACTFAGHSHKENGFNYQVSSGEATWYNLDLHLPGPDQDRYHAFFSRSPKQSWRDPIKTPLCWHMGQGPKAGINFISGSFWPYGNNAHHIIPVDDGLAKVFSREELLVLQLGKYNVHKGVNVIYLPTRTRQAKLFQILKHPKYHSTYSAGVRKQLNKLKRSLKGAADDEREAHPEVSEATVPRMGDQLHAHSARTRKNIRIAGQKDPGAHLNQLFEILSAR